jgi:hypothetical protein
MRFDHKAMMGVRHFERDFSWDINVEEMYFSMDGYELSWDGYQIQPGIR